MSNIRTIRVRAKGTGLLALIDADGYVLLGASYAQHRWAGRDNAGNPMIESVPEHAYYHRAIQHGDLELVGDESAPALTVEGGV
jgi:hypothetical protein